MLKDTFTFLLVKNILEPVHSKSSMDIDFNIGSYEKFHAPGKMMLMNISNSVRKHYPEKITVETEFLDTMLNKYGMRDKILSVMGDQIIQSEVKLGMIHCPTLCVCCRTFPMSLTCLEGVQKLLLIRELHPDRDTANVIMKLIL